MSLTNLRERLNGLNLSPVFGLVTKVEQGFLSANGLSPRIGDIVRITNENGNSMGMVTTLEANSFKITPFSFVEGTKVGDKVYLNTKGLQIPVGLELLGRVINPLGEPIDGKGELRAEGLMPIIRQPIAAMKRGMIDEVFSVGVKSIDGLLTCGKGQKLGIFAGSGVGKSTLMGMIVRGAQAKIKVIALIGERGREVPEFVEKNLGGDLTNTVLVVATSDDSPLMRKYGAFAAMSVAEYFKAKGEDVLFMMDSVTRFAMAQREIGLALGEPPTSKGYPPSVLTLLPQLMERAGKEEGKGSITAYFTVLVEGDDMSDPIADQSRSILDGHIVLDRSLTDFGIYPPINILNSASRLMGDVAQKEHILAARKFRRLYSMLKENEVLIRIGAYQAGSDKEIDEAIAKKSDMEDYLRQNYDESWDYTKSVNRLIELMQ
ncbi:flagellar protein export ATPase FliI [Helicobacter pullorum]|uniref:ATP synthase n=3 Tax=Helicobacter pullorum TaxID=35818 RepID=A0A377Q0E7_9HELI|nr:flagellar protein export ATPase FliI [Helicobacter pullorum]HIS09196.1 flagellar protein export ATPase FliI [Candidatus Scatomorpha intestinipullorum]EEQ63083.1 flagellum-specific ATP synthase [Helicobacter pullorum MIT 98-5489]KPH50848.1 ATP synthase [Helicobacter pullorum]KPH53720.1 ATP synthase [Helicobacter pullorum]OCR04016.1 EscN/YscN/HrcN family type III secretion system ATPase [Helicobacter pullorum]